MSRETWSAKAFYGARAQRANGAKAGKRKATVSEPRMERDTIKRLIYTSVQTPASHRGASLGSHRSLMVAAGLSMAVPH
ncbi:MAG: hypothetical protein FWG31_09815 [Oscillospiraceae bacterium]|nr:hypothetical protein [Oscillospiraceae bacterium]